MKNQRNHARLQGGLILAIAGLMSGIALTPGPGLASAQEAAPSWSYTGSLNTARQGHVAMLLPNGKVLVASGSGGSDNALNTAELYDPATGVWSRTGDLNSARGVYSATLLPNGRVLVLRDYSAELYDPDTGTWSYTGYLNTAQAGTATLLANGKVLFVGDNITELYDPGTGTWSYTGNLNTAHWATTATLLPNGKVLIVGGGTNSTELYDPSTGTWSTTGNLNGRRWYGHTATLLPNGKVLVAAGSEGGDDALNSAELYDPATGIWSRTGDLNTARAVHTATLLPNGKVLVAGGFGYNYDLLNSAELYDPDAGTWSITANLNTARLGTATLLPNGNVLVAGGHNNSALNSAELYIPFPMSSTFFVPIILSSNGAAGSFYTSELTLANRSGQDATVEFSYTAAFGGHSGQATDTLLAGKQRILSDAISYLRQLGLPIPESGTLGGTLRVRFLGLSSPNEAGVIVRITTAVPEGRAGVAYPGVPLVSLLDGPAYLCGLRQDATDRSNVALQNAGEPADGEITLRLRVFSGDPEAPFFQDLPEVVIPPGGFYQFNEILRSNGLSLASGYVRMERVSGSAPYYAYAVIHNQASSDGSFVPPALESPVTKPSRLTIPVVLGQEDGFKSELVLTNYSVVDKKINLSFLAVELEAFPTKEEITLRAGEQMILSDAIAWLRNFGFGHYERPFLGVTGPLVVTVEGQDASQLFLGMRVSAVDKGGQYGLFFPSIPAERESRWATWLFGLQNDAASRTNLAVVNLGIQPNHFTIELFDGETGILVGTIRDLTLNVGDWFQLSSLLAAYAPGITQGYARVVPSGLLPFVAYAVIHDGAYSGERTGDGNIIDSSP